MVKASRFFTEEEIRRIEEAVGRSEQKTSGEIVPVVATRSGRYDRAEDIIGVVLAVIAVAVVWLSFQRVEIAHGAWEATPTVAVELWLILVVFVVAFVVGAFLATTFPLLTYPVIPRREMRQEVETAARRAFFDFRLRSTQEGTGILLFVSLFERMVVVLGDAAIASKLSDAQWQEVRDRIIHGLKRGKRAEGLISAIERTGELLSEHFPLPPGDVNELPNTLHLID